MVSLRNTLISLGTFLPVVLASAAVDCADVAIDIYIVSLKPSADISAHISWVKEVHASSPTRCDSQGFLKQIDIGDLKMYTGEFDTGTAEQIKSNPDVSNIEKDSAGGPAGGVA